MFKPRGLATGRVFAIERSAYILDDKPGSRWCAASAGLILAGKSLWTMSRKTGLPEELVLRTAAQTVAVFREAWRKHRGGLPLDKAAIDAVEIQLMILPLANFLRGAGAWRDTPGCEEPSVDDRFGHQWPTLTWRRGTGIFTICCACGAGSHGRTAFLSPRSAPGWDGSRPGRAAAPVLRHKGLRRTRLTAAR
jgi:hypothetical protein